MSLSFFKIFSILAEKLPSRVLAALGIGFISSAGYTVAMNTLIDTATNNWNQLSGISLALLSLAGFPLGFGLILGAITARVVFSSFSRLGKVDVT